MKLSSGWVSPPKGATPLWRLLFAHADISAAVTGAVESLGTIAEPVTVSVADADSIQVDTPYRAVQIDEQGAIVFSKHRELDEAGRPVEREEPDDIRRPWDPAADRIIAMAWMAGLSALWHLLRANDLRLEGRHPSVLSPGGHVPLDALRGPGSDDLPVEWWPKCEPDYEAGSLRLLSGDRVWDVQIVRNCLDRQSSPQGVAGERRLEELVREQMLASPSSKLFTRDDVIAAAIERGLPENAGERAFDRAAGSLNKRDRAIWLRRGRISGGKKPLILPA